MPNGASNFRFQWKDSVIDLKMPYMSISVQYIKTHTVVLWFAVYSVRILVRRRQHGCLCTTVSIVLLKPICVMQWMFVRASAADSRSLVAVAVKYSWSLRNVLRHRSLSACVIVSYLKQVVWKEFMAKPSTELLERAFLALSHLCRQMKICDDCSLIDIDASF